jgi:ribonucleoside-diphosphate reductase alpha chain
MNAKIKKIKKRSGETVIFDQQKISNAILAAGKATGEFNAREAEKISQKVAEKLDEIDQRRKKLLVVEEIQDLVEITLMKENYTKTAKAYILYRKQKEEIREEKKKVLSGKSTTMSLSLNSLKILAGRYLKRDPETQAITELPEEMFGRVAKVLSNVEKKYGASDSKVKDYRKKFLEAMLNLEFLPAGRTLTNAGTSTSVASNCIVLNIEDSLSGIFKTLHDAALLQQIGSGIGFPFHTLRPAGNFAERTQGRASGPVSFLRVYDEAFGVIKQQGRHGANMGVMRVDHPDILDFIHAKEKEGEITNFNISVALTDKFMEKVSSNSTEPWKCKFGDKEVLPRKIIRDKYGKVTQIQEVKMTPSEIMSEIANTSWSNGEPGIIFIDEINRTNPLPGLGDIEASNPCGEQFLHDGDVCNLGSVNLAKFVKEGKVDWQRLEKVISLGTRMLDNVVDVTDFPVDRVNRMFRKNRRIGLGIMGFADLLFQLEIPYNSEAGFKMGEKVMKFINKVSHETSQKLAKEKGVFENYSLSSWKKKGIKMRNAACTCIAPTGTISMIPEVSSGIEPYFALAFIKQRVLGDQDFYYINPYLKEKLKEAGIYSQEIVEKIRRAGSIQDVKEIPNKIKKVFVGALDIAPEDHIKMDAAFQKHVDNSISKTINLPNNSTRFDVVKAIDLAWSLKCKAFTVYRSGSREEEVLKTAGDEKPSESTKSAVGVGECPDCNF